MAEILIYILHPNQQHCEAIQQAVFALNDPELVPAILTDLRHAPDEVRRQKPPIVLVGIDVPNDPAIRVMDQITQIMAQDISQIVVTKNATSDVIVPCTRAGAADFLSFPIAPDELREAIDRQLQRRGLRANEAGKVVGIFSGKGGVGVTMLACNLAANIAAVKKSANPSAILDLNVQFGVVAEMMDMKGKYSLADAVRDAERLDWALLKEYMGMHASGAYILPAPPSLEESEALRGDNLAKVIDLCRQNFAFTLIDLPHHVDGLTIPVLDQCDEVLLVCDLLFPTIRNTQKVLDIFYSLEYKKEKIKLVLNAYYKNDKVSLRDINNALKLPVYWLIPYDSLLARESIDAGVTVASINPASDLAESLMTLAQHMCGVKVQLRQKKKFSLFGSR